MPELWVAGAVQQEGCMRFIQIKKTAFRIRLYVCGLRFFSLPTRRGWRYNRLHARRFDPDLTFDEKVEYVSLRFEKYHGYPLRLAAPGTFSEKLQWLKLFNEDPLITTCADKYRVREYVQEKIGEDVLVPLLGVYDSPDQIDFAALPDRFVLKVNWGSGYNIICKDKNTLNIKKVKKMLAKWLKNEKNTYYIGFQFAYKNIIPKITCEQYIEQIDKNLLDYKFFCFHGTVAYVQVDSDRDTNHSISFYDRQWEKMNFRYADKPDHAVIPKPEVFEEMLALAEKLAQPFVFVRADLYNINAKIYFGELTFYPTDGISPFTPQEWDAKLGDLIDLGELQ